MTDDDHLDSLVASEQNSARYPFGSPSTTGTSHVTAVKTLLSGTTQVRPFGARSEKKEPDPDLGPGKACNRWRVLQTPANCERVATRDMQDANLGDDDVSRQICDMTRRVTTTVDDSGRRYGQTVVATVDSANEAACVNELFASRAGVCNGRNQRLPTEICQVIVRRRTRVEDAVSSNQLQSLARPSPARRHSLLAPEL